MFSSSNVVACHSNVKRESFSPVLLTFSVRFGPRMHPCIPPCPSFFPQHPSSTSPPTGNRWEVKGFTCRGSGLLPLACQRLITHILTQNSPYPGGGRPNSAGSHYRCCPNARTQISINAHFESCSWWEWHSATSDPFCVLPNHHQGTLSLHTLCALLLEVLRHQSYTKTLTPVIQQLSVISSPS